MIEAYRLAISKVFSANKSTSVALIGVILLIVFSVKLLATTPLRPGNLVPKEPVLTWLSPTEKTFRTLSLDAAQAKFQLENVGDHPVRILDVSTSCGCTTPKIDPMIIAPGKTGDVEVKATPLQIGEKYVDITLTTDSPASPTIVLKLHIVGSRRSPFLFEARGDLYFSSVGTQNGESRLILANQIEDATARPTPPLIKNDLKFIEISAPDLQTEVPGAVPGTLHRKYAFKAKNLLTEDDPSQSGQIYVVDPWDDDHVEIIHVHCEASPPIKVSPPRAILAVRNGVDQERPVARFVVATRETIPDLVVELEGEGAAALVLSRQKSDREKYHYFSVSLNAESNSDGLYYISVGRLTSTDRIRIPVAVRNEVSR